MPTVKRDDLFRKLMVESFRSHGLLGKLGEIATILVTTIFFIVPQELPLALGLAEPRLNIGRLKTVIEGQIYQQLFMSGNTHSTVFKSRKGDGLLLYIAPRISSEFLEDIATLGAPVKFIVVSNEAHESYAEDAKTSFPDALVITPKASRNLVEEAVHVDGVLEDHLDTLEKDFGFKKMFRFDENTRCTAERSFEVELFSGGGCLFVAQCGIGNYSSFSPGVFASGFQGLFTRGRYFRMYYYCFTKNHSRIRPFWTHMVKSVDNLKAAVFIHGDPITGNSVDVRGTLLHFHVPGPRAPIVQSRRSERGAGIGPSDDDF